LNAEAHGGGLLREHCAVLVTLISNRSHDRLATQISENALNFWRRSGERYQASQCL
jgi:hypothetical protein